MWNSTEASLLLSRTLDNIGYGLPMVRLRQKTFERNNENYALYPGERAMVSGSRAEGLTKILESDLDMLIAATGWICTTYPQNFFHVNQMRILKIEMGDTSPGYAKLLYEGPTVFDTAERLIQQIGEKSYLSSEKWRTEMRSKLNLSQTFERSVECSGPSCPVIFSSSENDRPFRMEISCDNVRAITCDCRDILQTWIDRPRNFFPSDEVIQEISAMKAHAVPVGYKGSEWQSLEWRICYTKAEIKLVKSLNECQTKLLILLKKIAKLCLKPACKEMTSYLMKNIVLWMSEMFPSHYFTEQNLFLTLSHSLKLISFCLIRKRLPSYMLAERNLLAERMTLGERSKLCIKIESLLSEGPQMIFRWGKVRSAMTRLYDSPDRYCNFSDRIIATELMFYIAAKCENSEIDRNIIDKFMKEVIEPLFPEILISDDPIIVHVIPYLC